MNNRWPRNTLQHKLPPYEEDLESVREIMGSDTLKYFYAVPLAVVRLLVGLNVIRW